VTAGERLVVGQVRGFHGLKGAVRVESLTDRAEDRFAVGSVLHREGSEAKLTIAEAVTDGLGWRLRFNEVSDRNAAESLRDVYLETTVGPGEELPRGEYYWHQIIGSAVADTDGTALGKVVDIYRAGGAEVIVVRGTRGETDIPLVRSLVRIFAPARGEIVVDGDALGLRGEVEADEVEPAAAVEPAVGLAAELATAVEPAVDADAPEAEPAQPADKT
jgi:16S rRNA processing protein RimM